MLSILKMAIAAFLIANHIKFDRVPPALVWLETSLQYGPAEHLHNGRVIIRLADGLCQQECH